MAVTLDLYPASRRLDLDVEPHTPAWRDNRKVYTLAGEVANWLKERGHTAQFVYVPCRDDYMGRVLKPTEYQITFEDESLAMLFKLTWL